MNEGRDRRGDQKGRGGLKGKRGGDHTHTHTHESRKDLKRNTPE